MTFNGQRMSKSLGTIIDPIEAATRFGADPLRLYLVKEIAFGGDGDFTWERFDERYNVDLANNLGNLVSRVAAMAEKYRGGRLAPAGAPGRLAEVARRRWRDYRTAMDALRARGRRRGGVPAGRRGQRVHRGDGAVGARARRRRRARRSDPGAVRRRRSGARRGRAAAADHAALGGGDPAPRRRDDGPCRFVSTPQWRNARRASESPKADALWPRSETTDRSTSESHAWTK